MVADGASETAHVLMIWVGVSVGVSSGSVTVFDEVEDGWTLVCVFVCSGTLSVTVIGGIVDVTVCGSVVPPDVAVDAGDETVDDATETVPGGVETVDAGADEDILVSVVGS